MSAGSDSADTFLIHELSVSFVVDERVRDHPVLEENDAFHLVFGVAVFDLLSEPRKVFEQLPVLGFLHGDFIILIIRQKTFLVFEMLFRFVEKLFEFLAHFQSF